LATRPESPIVQRPGGKLGNPGNIGESSNIAPSKISKFFSPPSHWPGQELRRHDKKIPKFPEIFP
jgi:hypothetical protein